MSGEPIFLDRRDAGRRLAQLLLRFRDDEPVVFALPRGGVPVAYEIAKALRAPLEVLVVRKIGAPSQRELAIGAIVVGGGLLLDELMIARVGASREYIDNAIAVETKEIERQSMLYRKGCGETDLREKTVIVVDDGLATGLTARAAIRALRKRGPKHLVAAFPVCAPQRAQKLEKEESAEVICLVEPESFHVVGAWYLDFAQVSDEEVIGLLQSPTGESA